MKKKNKFRHENLIVLPDLPLTNQIKQREVKLIVSSLHRPTPHTKYQVSQGTQYVTNHSYSPIPPQIFQLSINVTENEEGFPQTHSTTVHQTQTVGLKAKC